MMKQVRSRDIVMEVAGSLIILSSLVIIYLDALRFQDTSLVFTGDNSFGKKDYDFTRKSVFFKFWICDYSAYYAGYNAPLAFYLSLITIFALSIFKSSKLKIIISTSYILHLNAVSYLVYIAYKYTEVGIMTNILINLFLMAIATGAYIYDLTRENKENNAMTTNPLHELGALSIIGSACLLLGYLLAVYLDPLFQSNSVGYGFVLAAMMVVLPQVEQKLWYLLGTLGLTVSLVTWWVSFLGFVFVGVVMAVAHDHNRKQRKVKLRFNRLVVFVMGVPILGILFVLTLVRDFEGFC